MTNKKDLLDERTQLKMDLRVLYIKMIKKTIEPKDYFEQVHEINKKLDSIYNQLRGC